MRFGFSNARGVTTFPTELIMTRTLVLIAAPSLVVISLALSAHAQQVPNATPGTVEMTEPPTPAPAGFNNRRTALLSRLNSTAIAKLSKR